MNNSTRKHIATFSDERLDKDIARDQYKLDHSKLSHLDNIRRSLNNRLQAMLDEKQARLVGTDATYPSSRG